MESFSDFLTEISRKQATKLSTAVDKGHHRKFIFMKEPINTYADFMKVAKRHYRLKEIGHGMYATVYSAAGKPGEMVIRATRYGNSEYDGWIQFAKLAQSNRANPVFPRIHKLINLPYSEDEPDEIINIGIIEYINFLDAMEWTKELGEYPDLALETMYRLAVGNWSIEKMHAYAIHANSDTPEEMDEKLAEAYRKERKKILDFLKRHKTNPDHVTDFAQKLQSIRKTVTLGSGIEGYGTPDIKHDNVGFRKNGGLVFTDPLYIHQSERHGKRTI